MYILIVLLFLSSGLSLKAQIKTDISLLTRQEQQYLTTAKTYYKEYRKLRKQYLKDSTRLARKLKKEAKDKTEQKLKEQLNFLEDSLKERYDLEKYEPYASTYKAYKKDKKKFKKMVLEKARKEVFSELYETEQYQEIKELKDTYFPYLSEYKQYKAYLKNPDSIQYLLEEQIKTMESILEQKLMDFDEIAELKKQEQQMRSMLELPKNIREQMKSRVVKINEYASTDKEQIQSKATTMAKEKASEYAAEYNTNEWKEEYADKINQAVADMNELKKKYRSFYQSNGDTVKIKHSSLKNASPIERLIIGGNFNINRKDQITIDFSPHIGYRFNKLFGAGAGFSYRLDFGNESWQFNDSTIASEVKGYNAFVQHDIIKGFYFNAEYENLYTTLKKSSTNSDTEHTYKQWVPSVKAGIGRTLSLHGLVTGTMTLMYNFLHDRNKTPYDSKWQLKFGFRLNGEGVKVLKNRKKTVERLSKKGVMIQ